MSEVYANGMNIACKAAAGKTVAAMPDVCLSPPSPPAGPIPIPYPNTGMASDTTDGTKTVMIEGQEVMMKNSSTFKQSSGDEAATKSLGMGVVTHTIQGKVNFCAWSMDVKFEGANVPRHLDLTGHNEMSDPPNTPPWAYVDSMATTSIAECSKETENKKKACDDKGLKTRDAQCADKECTAAKKCLLVSYQQGSRDSKSTQVGCCGKDQPHHLVEVHCFTQVAGRSGAERLMGFSNYDDKAAPCVCASGSASDGDHGLMHAVQGKAERALAFQRRNEPLAAWGPGKNEASYWTYGEARDAGAKAHKAANPTCSEECTKAQLDGYHCGECKISPDDPVRSDLAERH